MAFQSAHWGEAVGQCDLGSYWKKRGGQGLYDWIGGGADPGAAGKGIKVQESADFVYAPF